MRGHWMPAHRGVRHHQRFVQLQPAGWKGLRQLSHLQAPLRRRIILGLEQQPQFGRPLGQSVRYLAWNPPLDYSLCASLGELSRRLASCLVFWPATFWFLKKKIIRVISNDLCRKTGISVGQQKLTSVAEDFNRLAELIKIYYLLRQAVIRVWL